MTSRRTKEIYEWTAGREKWRLPTADRNGDRTNRTVAKATRCQIAGIEPACGDVQSHIKIRDVELNLNYETNTDVSIGMNCYKCKARSIINNANKKWHKKLRNYREGKIEHGCEDLRDTLECMIEAKCQNDMESFPEEENEQLLCAQNDLDNRMPESHDEDWEAFTNEQLETRTRLAKEFQDEQETSDCDNCFWSDDEDQTNKKRRVLELCKFHLGVLDNLNKLCGRH